MEDTYKAKGLRRKLAQTVHRKGIHDERVLEAISRVPRHFFFDSAFLEQAYEDNAFPIGEGQTISQPFTVAYQTQALKVQPGMKVLEIGTGSGYQASILCEVGAEVYSIERIAPLHERAREILSAMGYQPHLKVGDGTEGWPEHAPYDRILITAAAPEPPRPLLRQLKVGGLMVVPVGDKHMQRMLRIERMSEEDYESEEMEQFRFVPLIGKEGFSGSWK